MTRTISTSHRSSNSQAQCPVGATEVGATEAGAWEAVLGQAVNMRSGTVAHGDFAGDPPHALGSFPADDRERVTWLRQVHGRGVVAVGRPGQRAGSEADAAISAAASAVLLVRTADCAPVGLGSAEGIAGIAHVGWRGLVSGVLEATVEAMKTLGASGIEAAIGPCIHASCYEFSESELAAVCRVVGGAVVARTAAGRPALDLVAGARSMLERLGVPTVAISGSCTHCSAEHWSWRARLDTGRQATLVWTGAAPSWPSGNPPRAEDGLA